MRRTATTSLAVLVLALAVAASAAPPVPRPVPVVAHGRVLRIMPLGTSSTVGVGSPQTAGYRGPLEAMLASDGIAFDMVGSQTSGPPGPPDPGLPDPGLPDPDHEGHSGWVLPQMQPLVGGWVLAARPDVILLQVGTNDLLSGATGAQDAARLAALLDAIHAVSDADVILAGVWAPMPGRTAAKAEFARLSAQLVDRLRLAGRPVTFVDTANLLGPPDIADGLHADAAGYRRIAAMWERELLARETARP